jgi:hypothetical protein
MTDWLNEPWLIEAIGTILLAILLAWFISKVFEFLDKE